MLLDLLFGSNISNANYKGEERFAWTALWVLLKEARVMQSLKRMTLLKSVSGEFCVHTHSQIYGVCSVEDSVAKYTTHRNTLSSMLLSNKSG